MTCHIYNTPNTLWVCGIYQYFGSDLLHSCTIHLKILLPSCYVLQIQQVQYFGGWSLDSDPNFGWCWHFCGTIVNICTDRNPYERGTQNYIRQRRGAYRLYLKIYIVEEILVLKNAPKLIFLLKITSMCLYVKKARIFKCF